MSRSRLFLVPLASCICASVLFAQISTEPAPVLVGLPTDNDALLRSDGKRFYMYVDRNFENQQSTPWEGGQFGFVRGPVRLGSRVVMMAFHEGLDIAPLKRDAAGEPLDEIRSMADGEVVYVNDTPGSSNYGRYVVIKHTWPDGTFYSLYAHLSKITIANGTRVSLGTPIAIMGHTGAGLDRRRSHLHVEMNVFLSGRFKEWHEAHFKPSPNHHGLYNGLNLSGMNLAAFFLAKQKDPTLTVSAFIKTQEVEWKVVLPRKEQMELLKNNPWLGEGLDSSSPSLEISFTGSGLPIRITPSPESTVEPKVSWVKDTGIPHVYHTRKYVSGTGGQGTLTASGGRFIQLITGEVKSPAKGSAATAE